jgi:toxin FitB
VSGWLLDINVVSELRKPRPEPKVVSFVAKQSLERLFLSEVTLAQIRFGIGQVDDAARRARLSDWLNQKLRPMFGRRVLPITEHVILKWRFLVEEGRKARHMFMQPDLFIASTALHHGLTVVTRDTDDYLRTRVSIFNPWADPHPSA